MYENASKTLPAEPPAPGKNEKLKKKFWRFISDTFAIIGTLGPTPMQSIFKLHYMASRKKQPGATFDSDFLQISAEF